MGTFDTFTTYGGPANLLETANTIGLPLYARQMMDAKGRWIDLMTEGLDPAGQQAAAPRDPAVQLELTGATCPSLAAAIDNLFCRSEHRPRCGLYRRRWNAPSSSAWSCAARMRSLTSERAVWSETTRIDLRVAEVPNPRPGDRIEIDGDAFLIQGEPVRDRERLVWTSI
jgi:hypothetical protein